ncbi:hypothetical protein A9Q98_12960 [Thalassotalea sp. 42_200_T64]|nr:hypothetical protein A9Q98_12960 [Thalassotalea sp. 42_200_T64]
MKVVNHLAILSVLLISGCNTIPAPLQVPETTPLVAFADARAMPAAHIGMQARWGGVIAEVKTLEQQTMLEIVSMELKDNARPRQKDSTEGRFRVYVNGLLDPVIYQQGRHVTALGVIAESETGLIGELEYLYPKLTANNVYLWKKINKIRVEPMHHPMWYSPYYWHFSPRYRYYSRPVHYSKPKPNVSKGSSTQ